MKNVIVADIDGCCVFSDQRLPHFLRGDLEAWHAAHPTDQPIPQGVVVYRKFLTDPDFRFVFLTGRPESARAYTLAHLQWWIHPSITHEHLLMRPDHIKISDMPDSELKPVLLELSGVPTSEVFLVFEDRRSIVDKWRSLGVTVYQTDVGDF